MSNQRSIDPYDYYSQCPHCGHWDWKAIENSIQCLSCTWQFTVVLDPSSASGSADITQTKGSTHES